MYSTVVEQQMRAKVDACKQSISKLLNAHKSSVFHCADATEVQQHSYSDKYLMAEQLTTSAAVCLVNCFEALLSESHPGNEESTTDGGGVKDPALATKPSAHHVLQELREWAVGQEVTLRFELQEGCEFEREQQRDEEDPTRVVTEVVGMFKSTSKVVRKVTEFFYRFNSSYRLVAYRGVYTDTAAASIGDGSGKSMILRQKTAQQQLVTRNTTPPFPQNNTNAYEVNISWLLRLLHADSGTYTVGGGSLRFDIDRAHAQCYTPYQNRDVLAAEAQLQQLGAWAQRVVRYLQQQLFEVQRQYNQQKQKKLVDTSAFTASDVFNPIVPLLEDRSFQPLAVLDSTTTVAATVEDGAGANLASTTSSTVLAPQTVNLLAAEQKRTLLLRCAEVQQLLLTDNAATTANSVSTVAEIIAPADANFCIVLSHMQQLVISYIESVQFIEDMIRKQLVAAVGRVLQPSDFSQYMIFHNRKLLREQYKPQPFSFAIRRSAQHSPEGLLRIELAADSDSGSNAVDDASLPEAIYTIASHHSCSSSDISDSSTTGSIMEFAINASTKIQFGGDRYVHGWLAHHFYGQQPPQLQLVAQARQFSSYIVLLGRIASAREFDPKFAFIVQNKDELQIPLQLERIPTPKEFKDAIASLSPEQQRFARAFRSMQLESTLFAVCTIQIKPQLEQVLRLIPDSLTKEIQLTQQLMKLFIEYQIPSDLLSFDPIAASTNTVASATSAASAGSRLVDDFEMVTSDGSATAGGGDAGGTFTSADRLRVVKAQVKAMQQMIDSAKEEELGEKNREREFQYGMSAAPQNVRSLSVSMSPQTLCPPSAMSSAASFGGLSQPRGLSGCVIDPFSAPAAPVSQGRTFSMQQQQKQQPQQRQQQHMGNAFSSSESPAEKIGEMNITSKHSPVKDEGEAEGVNYTRLPALLDARFEQFDADSALRPTIITPGSTWQKKAQAALLSKPATTTLHKEQQQAEKQAAFDLLDALTRSGALALQHATLHVLLGATHCFDKSLMDIVVQRNVNPIEKVERSTLIMASALHGLSASGLVQPEQLQRVSTYCPALFNNDHTFLANNDARAGYGNSLMDGGEISGTDVENRDTGIVADSLNV